MQPVVLLGGGGHAGVVLETCRAAGVRVVGFQDDDPACQLALAPDAPLHLGPIDPRTLPIDKAWVLAIGELDARSERLSSFNPAHASDAIVHPNATVSPTARLGAGTVVFAGAVVQRHAAIGAHAILNSGCIVEHDCTIGSNTHLAPGSVLGGGCRVGSDTIFGIRASMIPSRTVGDGCTVGAGAVVTCDVGDGRTVVGVPARTPMTRVA